MNMYCLIVNAVRYKCLVVSIGALPIHQHAIRHPELLSVIKGLP